METPQLTCQGTQFSRLPRDVLDLTWLSDLLLPGVTLIRVTASAFNR